MSAAFYRVHVNDESDRYGHRFATREEAEKVLNAIGRRGYVAAYNEHGKLVAESDGYPNWTHRRMGDVFREAGKMMAVYHAAPQNEPPDMDFYRHQMRVLYDLLRGDGR